MTLLVNKSVPGRWSAAWCWSAERGGPNLTVRRFRRPFELDSVPESFVVFVSADSRYVLRVNGQVAGRGPLKGQIEKYHYEACNIAEHLRPGLNVLSAEVRWFGLNAPNSEIHTGFAGFLLQGPAGAGLDTPGQWKVQVDRAIEPDTTPYIANAHQFLDHTERVDARLIPAGWTEPDFDDSDWEPAQFFAAADWPDTWGETAPIWDLHPRPVPALTEEPRRFARTIEDMKPAAHRFGDAPTGWSLEAGQGGEIVLDAGALTTGYLQLHFTGGAGREVQVIYAEAIGTWTQHERRGRHYTKAIRDDLSAGVVDGYRDTVTLPGGSFTYEPFHWRTFWFVRIVIGPGDAPVSLDDVRYRFTTYPVELGASYESSAPDSAKMLEVSWRTLQLCTHETYEDCPYYEQLHYLWDSRIEALCGLAMAGDTTMPKRSLKLYRDSLEPTGLLHCRVPSRRRHRLPFFALAWVLMLHDYWRWVGPQERDFVRSCLFAADGVLVWFRNLLREDGFLGPVPHWSPLPGSMGEAAHKGGSVFMTSLYAWALESAAELHEQAGDPVDAERWRPLAERLRGAVREKAWSEAEGLFTEAPGLVGGTLGQRTQAMAILSGAATAEQTARIMDRLASDPKIGKSGTVEGYYFARALEKAGRYDLFDPALLPQWRDMLDKHLSTWREGGEPGRSDCHAWTAWPAVDFLTCVLGIQPAKPGFAEIRIRPHTETYTFARGQMPTVVGTVRVEWTRDENGQVSLKAQTPAGVPTVVELPGQEPRRFEQGGEIEM